MLFQKTFTEELIFVASPLDLSAKNLSSIVNEKSGNFIFPIIIDLSPKWRPKIQIS